MLNVTFSKINILSKRITIMVQPRPSAERILQTAIAAIAARTVLNSRRNAGQTGKKSLARTSSKAKPKYRTRSRVSYRKGGRGETPQVTGYTRKSVALGRPLPKTLKSAWKILDAAKTSTIIATREYNRFGGVSGVVTLPNIFVNANYYQPPVRIYDLSSCINVKAGTVLSYAPGVIPVFQNPTDSATITWQSNTPTNWQLENADNVGTITDVYPGATSMLEYVQAKMLFYAATTVTSRFQVDIVSYTDQRCNPDPINNSNEFNMAFWQAQLKRFCFNPLEGGDSKYSKYIKTLHSQTFIMDPKETTESEATHMREVSVFLRTNAKMDYSWEDKDRMFMDTPNEGQVNKDDNIKNTVPFNKRLYLVVRAQSKFDTTGYSPLIHPSFDLVLKAKHTQMSS